MVGLSSTQPGPDRHRLGFAEAVSEAFAFLLEMGFQLVEKSDTLARYESNRRVVRVFHGRGSYELGVEIGRWIEVDGVNREQAFPLQDVVSLQSDPDELGYSGTSATTVESVHKFIGRLAEWTLQFGAPLLTDGDAMFDDLSARNAARGAAGRDAQRAALLRSRASEAWRCRDFGAVVNAYSEIDKELPTADLSVSERGRLDYALKALND